MTNSGYGDRKVKIYDKYLNSDRGHAGINHNNNKDCSFVSIDVYENLPLGLKKIQITVTDSFIRL